MVVNFSKTLPHVLSTIGVEDVKEFTIQNLQQFQQVLWEIIDLLNERYVTQLAEPFDHYNWINHNQNDEVAYFLNEATSNIFNYTEGKLPLFQLWFGSKGFVIGITQPGKGFNAQEVHTKNSFQNQGGAFTFFKQCKQTIFFDSLTNTTSVYLEYIV